jgi:CheY-like chemotaxis protein
MNFAADIGKRAEARSISRSALQRTLEYQPMNSFIGAGEPKCYNMNDTISGSATILIIWDDEDIPKLFAYALKPTNYVVKHTYSWAEGLDICLAQPPDVLIIPRTSIEANDGFVFCQQLRSNPKISRFPIIIGQADGLDLDSKQCIQRTYEIGANACFGRVYNITDVVALINTLLENPILTQLADRQTLHFSQQQ